MRRILKWIIGLMVINTIIWAAGQAITRSRSTSDLEADELEFYTFWDGAEFVPRSASLRSVTARVLMGGATVDLRSCEIAPEGAMLDIGTTMGGTAVLVRKDWEVEVSEETRASGVEVRLDTDADRTDAPTVAVRLATTFGGAFVGYELPADMTA